MTPVAAPVAFSAMTWDAALEETLSRATGRPSATTSTGSVYSVHRRAVNVLLVDRLIAVVSAELDDAPWSIRLSPADWSRLDLRPGAAAHAEPDGIRLATADGEVLIRLTGGIAWTPYQADLGHLEPADLVWALDLLAPYRETAPQTPFGRASAALLTAGVDGLREAILDVFRVGIDGIPASMDRLIGLGEGLTPSGDDVITGFAFVAAQRGMALNRVVPSLAASVRSRASHTTALSLATTSSALEGRGRQRMHDLARAVSALDADALRDAAGRTLAIGHSSGADMLTGMRLALELEARVRATASAPRRPQVPPLTPPVHRPHPVTRSPKKENT
ncbi:DUF2877 domain-containing protein [Microbacterium sp.]|uniref:DUF2877 domain-containing protein n=1 Tax=Microbacterium sp. TaxID=51671 RepID=UPI002811E868|nr:DUF2877 domain-containing protein [Microbacterium sp.]